MTARSQIKPLSRANTSTPATDSAIRPALGAQANAGRSALASSSNFSFADLAIFPPHAAAFQDLPHRESLQRSFGSEHDLSSVRANIGPSAAGQTSARRAAAITQGENIRFASFPSLELAAHEAAHVIQQRRGAASGSASNSTRMERQADAVAAAVTSQRSAASLLSALPARSPVATAQLREEGPPPPSAATALIDQFRSVLGLNINEEALGARLAEMAEQAGDARLIAEVLAALDRTDRAQVATAMVFALEQKDVLAQIAKTEPGFTVLTAIVGSLRKVDRQPMDLLMRAIFPAPPPLPEHSYPIFAKGLGLQIIAYESGGVYRDLSGNIIGEKPIESTLSPIDFIGGIGAMGRMGVRAITVRNLRSAVGTTFTPNAWLGVATSGVAGALVNGASQVLTLEDIRDFNWGNMAAEAVVAAAFGAWVSKVMTGVPLKITQVKELFSVQSLEILLQQQGLLAPASYIANLIRATVQGNSPSKAASATGWDSLLSVPLNGVVQVLLQGWVGDQIFPAALDVTKRLATPQAAMIRAVIAQLRQAVIRALVGLGPSKNSGIQLPQAPAAPAPTP